MESDKIITKRICVSLCRDFNKVELELVVDGSMPDNEKEGLKLELIDEAKEALKLIDPKCKSAKAESSGENKLDRNSPATEKQINMCIGLGYDEVDAQYLRYGEADAYIKKNYHKKR